MQKMCKWDIIETFYNVGDVLNGGIIETFYNVEDV